MLPTMDGFGIVRRLRSSGKKNPILLLTARDSAEDIVVGLDAGADDYLTKPFALKVLLARLRALARRREVEPRTNLRIGDLQLDPAEHAVKRGESAIALTRTEFLLLETLMRNAGRVVTRDRLIEAVWGNEREVESNTLDVYIRQLRSKIEPAGSTKLIQTVRGVGYIMREEEARETQIDRVSPRCVVFCGLRVWPGPVQYRRMVCNARERLPCSRRRIA